MANDMANQGKIFGALMPIPMPQEQICRAAAHGNWKIETGPVAGAIVEVAEIAWKREVFHQKRDDARSTQGTIE